MLLKSNSTKLELQLLHSSMNMCDANSNNYNNVSMRKYAAQVQQH